MVPAKSSIRRSSINLLPRSLTEMRWAQRSVQEEGGQSAVELALILPVFLLILTGLMVFGVALNNYLLLTDATSVGTRQLSISRAHTTDPCQTASSAIISAAMLLNKSNMTFTYYLNGQKYTGTTCASSSTTTGAAANLVQNSPVQVIVSYPCTLVVFRANYAPTCNLQAQMTELVQ